MAKDYTSLLGRDSNAGFADIASAYLRGGSRKNKNSKKLLFASLFFNLREANMQSKVIKNLEQSDRDRIFDEAQVTNKWNAYNTLMNDDAEFKNNPNYFRLKAETEFAKNNPNFPTGNNLLKSEIDFRDREVEELEEALTNLHNNKIKTGNVEKRLTKEEFFKPFEDYYVSEKQRIAAPENVSLVHKGINFLTGKKKEELTNIERENAKKIAMQSDYGYLLNPDEITEDAVIKKYKPTEMVVTKGEAASQILSTVKSEDIARNLISGLTKEKYSRTELSDYVTMNVVDFNPYIEKYKSAYDAYDARFYSNKKDIPVEGDADYKTYIIQRNAFADRVTGLGDKDTAQVISDLHTLKDLNMNPDENAEIIKVIEARLASAQTSVKDRAIFQATIAHISEPNQKLRIDTDIKNGKYKDIKDYALQYSQSLREAYDIISE